MSLCAKILGFDFHKITWNPVDFDINLVEVDWVQAGIIIALPQLLVAAATNETCGVSRNFQEQPT